MAKKITNYYKYAKSEPGHNPYYNDHHIEVPFRMIVIAATGGGKTNFFLELVHRMSDTFEEIIVCTRDRDEPLYNLLKKRLKAGVVFYESKVPDLDDFKNDKKQRLICFDDLILDKSLQSRIGEYFVRGRKQNFSCVYLSQSYFAIPTMIRHQAGYIVLKKMSGARNWRMMMSEFAIGLNIDELQQLYRKIVGRNTLEFLMIDMINPDYKYRHNFTPLDITE